MHSFCFFFPFKPHSKHWGKISMRRQNKGARGKKKKKNETQKEKKKMINMKAKETKTITKSNTRILTNSRIRRIRIRERKWVGSWWARCVECLQLKAGIWQRKTHSAPSSRFSAKSWFFLQLGVLFEGEKLAIFPENHAGYWADDRNTSNNRRHGRTLISISQRYTASSSSTTVSAGFFVFFSIFKIF